MRKTKTLIVSIPFMIILMGLLIYQYGYLRIRSELATIQEEQAIKTRTLEKYINLISEKPHLEGQLASLRETRKADDSKLIEGQTPSLAAAQLQEIVKSTVTGRGGTISSERVGKPGDLGKFKVISVSVDASIPDSRALSEILYSIETRTPNLVIKELDTRVKNYRDPRELMVKLDVSALTGGR
ncbi:MAG: type II secretion system protein GspM [Nitrospirota bacterium]